MFLMLAPGALCCALLATLREPARSADASAPTATRGLGMDAWWSRRRIFLPHHLFMSLTTLAMVATTFWLPSVLIREHAMATRGAGLLFGSVLATTGVCSSVVGGVLADRAGRRAHSP